MQTDGFCDNMTKSYEQIAQLITILIEKTLNNQKCI